MENCNRNQKKEHAYGAPYKKFIIKLIILANLLDKSHK